MGREKQTGKNYLGWTYHNWVLFLNIKPNPDGKGGANGLRLFIMDISQSECSLLISTLFFRYHNWSVVFIHQPYLEWEGGEAKAPNPLRYHHVLYNNFLSGGNLTLNFLTFTYSLLRHSWHLPGSYLISFSN